MLVLRRGEWGEELQNLQLMIFFIIDIPFLLDLQIKVDDHFWQLKALHSPTFLNAKNSYFFFRAADPHLWTAPRMYRPKFLKSIFVFDLNPVASLKSRSGMYGTLVFSLKQPTILILYPGMAKMTSGKALKCNSYAIIYTLYFNVARLP